MKQNLIAIPSLIDTKYADENENDMPIALDDEDEEAFETFYT